MKKSQLKSLIAEIVKHVLKEGKLQDPTKEEMLAFLHQRFDRLMDQRSIEEDGEEAMYWFATFNYDSQWSNLYSVLSTSDFHPGRNQRGPEKGGAAEIMYDALSQEFGNGKSWDSGNDDEEEVQEALPNAGGKKFTVSYVVLGLEQIPDTTHNTRQEALKAARDFIQKFSTKKSQAAGEKMVAGKNGYAIRHVGGGTVALAKINDQPLYENEEQTEKPEDAMYVEYVGDWPGEKPFVLQTSSGQSKFEYCKAKYPNGKVDLGVYAYRGDVCYGYKYFQRTFCKSS